ncbi:hypothetical protein vseg_010247 [Gypsophila vaccaria]
MEVAVRVEKSEQGCVKDSGKPGSESATLKQVTDPVVYKLVRVDIDGKLVPATDNELREVENLLELDKNDIVPASDDFETAVQDLDKDGSKTSHDKGSPQINNDEGDEDKAKPHIEDSLYASDFKSKNVDISCNIMGGSDLEDGSNNNGSAGSRPNFSLSKGEINLDKLTIPELQKTFRATFGRVTSIKDKTWLKRRIAMGLTNSCDVAVTSFVIKNGKFLSKMEDFHNTIVREDSVAVAGEACSAGDDMSANSGSHSNPRTNMEDGGTFKSSLSDCGCKSDDNLEHRAAKRVRKPTKRYIEELSDIETINPIGKSTFPSKCNEEDKSSLSSPIKTTRSINTGALLTRRDSIGGSGVQVPYVSRVRRCRPRQNIMTLSKFEPSDDVALTSRIVESSDAPINPQSDISSTAKLLDMESVPCKDPIASKDLVEKQSTVNMSDSSQDREPKGTDSRSCTSRDNVPGDDTGTNSDDNVATVPTAKGGMRRKHHRAWTLSEVLKLVDGVSRFGPGRWSEIKRLSFSSYSYRTAVDLKDKWRNLLKASFSSFPPEKGVNPRTKVPLPIPAPILVKVRELAEMNGQAPQTFKVSTKQGQCVSNVNVNR